MRRLEEMEERFKEGAMYLAALLTRQLMTEARLSNDDIPRDEANTERWANGLLVVAMLLEREPRELSKDLHTAAHATLKKEYEGEA